MGRKDIKPLSIREFEVLFWISNGLSIKEIAKEMRVSSRIIKNYIKDIKIKTNSCKKSQLIIFYNEILSRE